MRKRLLVLMLAVVSIMVSCSKDSDSVNNKLSAKIDGENWNATLRVTNLTGEIFVITGTSTTGEVMVITINGKVPDLYELSLTSLKCNATYKKSALITSASDIYNSVSGKVNLTKVDIENKKISGTFEFTMAKLSSQTISVSNGSFNDLEFQTTPL